MDEMDALRHELDELRAENAGLRARSDDADSRRLQALTDEAPIPYQSLDAGGKILVVNEAWLEATGYSRDEVIGQPFTKLLCEPDRAVFRQAFPRLKSVGYLRERELRLRKRDGSVLLATYTGRVARNADASFRQTHCIFQDITERRAGEERQRVNEERMAVQLQLHQMASATPDEIAGFALDACVRLTGSESGYLAFLNESGDILTIWAWAGGVIEQCQVEGKPTIYKVSETGLWGQAVRERRPIIVNDYDADAPGKCGLPPGHIRLLRVLNVPIFDGDRIVALVGVANKSTDYDETDSRQLSLLMDGMWGVTVRQRSARALEDSERRLQLVLDATSDAFWDLNFVTGQSTVSPRWAELLGYSHEELESAFPDWEPYAHPGDLERFAQAVQDHIQGLTPVLSAEIRLCTASGDHVWFLVRGKIVESDAAGNPLRMTGTGVDISERKRMEEQLQSAQRIETVARLAGGIAHDFNNLLTAIIGHAELIESGLAPDDSRRGNVRELRGAADRAARLTRQLLSFARRQNIEPRNVSLCDLLGGVAAAVQKAAGDAVAVHIVPPALPLWIFADPGQVEQVVLNLAIDARDAMPGGGTLTIEVRASEAPGDAAADGVPTGRYAMIAVSDTGIGMSPEVAGRVFEPFFTTKEACLGAGLGLPICHGIVTQAGGHIRVSSTPGAGTTVRVYLPAVAAPAGSVEPGAPVSSDAGSTTLLLVEDEALVRRMVADCLRGRGYTVLDADCGAQALELFEAHGRHVDLLVTDVVMPGQTGPEVARRLRQEQPDLKVLFVSGYTETAFNPAEHGAGTSFLPKPFTPTMLAHRVRELLEAS